jgi:hypothetical protein
MEVKVVKGHFIQKIILKMGKQKNQYDEATSKISHRLLLPQSL